MKNLLPLLALALLASGAAAAPPTRATMPEGLPSVLNDTDYPDEAIRNREQGTVQFRLDIGSDGKPTGCTILSSSGSSLLDTTTCRIMMERPRFQPARDKRGRPTSDQITNSVTWRIPPDEDAPPGLDTAFGLWSSCVMGEASKLIPGELPVAEIVARSFAPCGALETLLSEKLGTPLPLKEPRDAVRGMIETAVPQVRKSLKDDGDAAAQKKL